MADYIKRDSVTNLIKLMEYPNGTIECYADEFISDINAIPSADVAEVKHGMWQILAPYNNMNRPRCRCTNCGLTHVFPDFYSIQYNFCPECGAYMRKDGE